MKKLLLILLAGLGASAGAQQITNVIYGNVGDYSLNPLKKINVTSTLVQPNPRTVNNIMVRQDSVNTITDTNGYFAFTNQQWGSYTLTLSGASGTTFAYTVNTNSTGQITMASLVGNNPLPPDPSTNFYTISQINALLAVVSAPTNGSILIGIAASNLVNGPLPSGLLTAGLSNGPGHLLIVINGIRYTTLDGSTLTNLTAANMAGIVLSNQGVIFAPTFLNNSTYTNSSGQSFKVGISTDGSLEVTSPAGGGAKGGRLGSNYVAGANVYGNIALATNATGSLPAFQSDVTTINIAINGKVSTNFGVAQNLTMNGSNANTGTLTNTGTITGGLMSGVIVEQGGGMGFGTNRPNSWNTFGSQDVIRMNTGPWEWIGPNNDFWYFSSSGSGVAGDNAIRFQKGSTGYIPQGAFPFLSQSFGGGVEGAPFSFYAPWVGGSAGSMTGLPQPAAAVHDGQSHAFLGSYTDMANAPANQVVTWEKPWTNLINHAKWWNTNGVAAILASYGIQTWVWGDNGPMTNRTVTGNSLPGSLQFDTNILSIAGAPTWAEYDRRIHTNGVRIGYAMYEFMGLPIQTNGDTAVVLQQNDGHDHSWPSSGTFPYWVETTPDTVAIDMITFYTNGVDMLISQDREAAGLQGYEQRLLELDYNILFPQAALSDHVYWKDQDVSGLGPRPALNGTFPPGNPLITNQMVLCAFVDNPSSVTPERVNSLCGDQNFSNVGIDNSIAIPMAYVRTYNESVSNWPAGKWFPIITTAAADLNNSAWTKRQYTNALSIAEMFKSDWFSDIDTNTWGVNTNSLIYTNNPLYLTLWMENTLAWPKRIFDDGTNSCWIRNIDGGSFLVYAGNQSASVSNFSANLCGIAGFPTNMIFTATNVMNQLAFDSGYVTNTFTNSMTATNTAYIVLRPLNLAVPQLNATEVFASGDVVIGASASSFAYLTNTANDTIRVLDHTRSDGATFIAGGIQADSFMSTPAVTINDNSFRWSGGIFKVGLNAILSFNNNADPNSGSQDAAIWRQAAGVMEVTNALVVPGTITATNGYLIPTNAVPSGITNGLAKIWNSNHVVYLRTSTVGSATEGTDTKLAP